MATYLLPISDREPLAWILREGRTAFPSYRRSEASKLRRGDRILLYTTRSCFHNPTRDRGRIIGTATVATSAEDLPSPVRFGGREFSIGVRLTLDGLVARGEGVELAPLIEQLRDSFPQLRGWSARIRRALVPLAATDAQTLERAFARIRPGPVERVLATYEQAVPTGRRS